MSAATRAGRIACIGGAAVDRTYRLAAPLAPRTSNPATGRISFGGVARNIAENLARLQIPTSLTSVVGDDDNGRLLARQIGDLGVDVSGVMTLAARSTAEYVAVVDVSGDLALGLADMAIFDHFPIDHLRAAWPRLANADWIAADCNLLAPVLRELIARCGGGAQRLAIDAVSTAKVARLPASLAGVDLLFLNRDEAAAYLNLSPDRMAPADADIADELRDRGARHVIVTRGAEGLTIASDGGAFSVAGAPCHFRNATGAGDALIAGTLFRLLAGETLVNAARAGAALAALTTECDESVRADLTPALLEAAMRADADAGSTP